MTEWRPIPKWENLYEVSSDGDIRNIATKHIRVPDVNNCGYYRVMLYDKPRKERFFIHRLVATVFIHTDNLGKQVNHKDGDKSNNTVSNLEWLTQSENEIHAIKLGLKGSWRGPFIVCYDENLFGVVKENQTGFAREIGVSDTLVRSWLNGKSSTYMKYGIREIYFLK